MATYKSTVNDPDAGSATVKITGLSPKMPTTDKEIDSTLSEAENRLEAQKGRLNSQGQAIVDDAQHLIEITRKNELFQKLFTFARKAQNTVEGTQLQSTAQGAPSADLMSAGRTLMDQVTGMASSLQTDAEDISGYIRNSLYNFMTSAEYREIAADFYSILRSLASEVEGEFKDLEDDARKPKRTNSQRPWNKPLNLPKPDDKPAERQPLMKKQGGQTDQKSEAWKAKMQKFEDEEIEDIQNQLNNFLQRIAEKKEYQQLVNNFFKYSDQLNDVLIDVTEKAKQSPEAKEIRELLDQSFEILGDFAGKNNVEKYRKDLVNLFNKIKEDKDLKKWREGTRDYIEDSLKNPQVEDVDADKAVEKLKELIRDGRKVLNKYNKDINAVYEDQVKIAQKIKNDPTLKEFEQSLRSLGSNLALNSKGEVDPKVMQESMSQITTLLAGLFHKYLATLPISKVEIYSPDYDIVLEDIKVEGTGFAPDMIEITTKSHSRLWFVDGHTNQSALQINLSVANISPAFKNFKFYFNHKSFPTYEDTGRASIECDEDGLSITASLIIRSQGDLPSRVSLSKLSVNLGTLTITTGQETKHTILTPLLSGVFSEQVRSRVEHVIYNALRARFDDIVIQMNQFFEDNPIQRVAGTTLTELAANIKANLPSAEDKTKIH